MNRGCSRRTNSGGGSHRAVSESQAPESLQLRTVTVSPQEETWCSLPTVRQSAPPTCEGGLPFSTASDAEDGEERQP